MENEPQDKTKVRIYTDKFMIVGEIAMFSDARLTDFMVGAHPFIAVTNAVVRNLEDRAQFTADFLNIQKDKIVIILPEAMVKPDYAARRRWPLDR
jgi:Family of unknown function (DUF6812)